MGKVTLVGIVWIGVIESSAISHRAPLMAIIMIPIVLLPRYLGAFAVTTVLYRARIRTESDSEHPQDRFCLTSKSLCAAVCSTAR